MADTSRTNSSTWTSVEGAAGIVGVTPLALRRSIERNARRLPDGSIEARLDGIVARKLGRRWRVALSTRWTNPTP